MLRQIRKFHSMQNKITYSISKVPFNSCDIKLLNHLLDAVDNKTIVDLDPFIEEEFFSSFA